MGVVSAFAQTLRRYTSLNHLAQAARAVLQNTSQINQMLSDLNRVDFANVQVTWQRHPLALPCSGLTSKPQLDAAGSSSLPGLYICSGKPEACAQPPATCYLVWIPLVAGLTSSVLVCLHSKCSQPLDLVWLALSCQKSANNCRVEDSPWGFEAILSADYEPL